jgi:DNA-directed RNA polymerase subunit RPC12/RpoP
MRDKNSTNSGFRCTHCGAEVSLAQKTARNHCNHCLWSLHVDEEIPGDRLSECGGEMQPAAIFQKRDEWIVLHKCEKCGKEIQNKCAEDDSFEALLNINSLQNG